MAAIALFSVTYENLMYDIARHLTQHKIDILIFIKQDGHHGHVFGRMVI